MKSYLYSYSAQDSYATVAVWRVEDNLPELITKQTYVVRNGYRGARSEASVIIHEFDGIELRDANGRRPRLVGDVHLHYVGA